eukprot:29692-Eustigmatos_ZCMA.PRE.1
MLRKQHPVTGHKRIRQTYHKWMHTFNPTYLHRAGDEVSKNAEDDSKDLLISSNHRIHTTHGMMHACSVL